MLEKIVGIFRKGEQEPQEPRGELFELAASGKPLFSEETQVELEARGGPEGFQAYEDAVREAILTGKPAFRNVGERE